MEQVVFSLIIAVLIIIYVIVGLTPFISCLLRKLHCTLPVEAEIVDYTDRVSPTSNAHKTYFNAMYKYYSTGSERIIRGSRRFDATGRTDIKRTIYINPKKPDQIYEKKLLTAVALKTSGITIALFIIISVLGVYISDAPWKAAFFTAFDKIFPVIVILMLTVPTGVIIMSLVRLKKVCTEPVISTITGHDKREHWTQKTTGVNKKNNSLIKKEFFVELLKFDYYGKEYECDGLMSNSKDALGKTGDIRELMINPNDPNEYRIIKTR